MIRNKKLIFINILALAALVLVVGYGIQNVDATKGPVKGVESEKIENSEMKGFVSKDNSLRDFQFKLKSGDDIVYIDEDVEEIELEEVDDEEVIIEEEEEIITNEEIIVDVAEETQETNVNTNQVTERQWGNSNQGNNSGQSTKKSNSSNSNTPTTKPKPTEPKPEKPKPKPIEPKPEKPKPKPTEPKPEKPKPKPPKAEDEEDTEVKEDKDISSESI